MVPPGLEALRPLPRSRRWETEVLQEDPHPHGRENAPWATWWEGPCSLRPLRGPGPLASEGDDPPGLLLHRGRVPEMYPRLHLLIENGPRAAYHRGCLDDELEKAYQGPEAGEGVRLEHGKGNSIAPREA